MNGTITTKAVITHPYFSMICSLALWYILPQYGGGAVTMLGCAGLLTTYLLVLPESFRGRRGALTTAICLVAFLWLAAAVIATLTLSGTSR